MYKEVNGTYRASHLKKGSVRILDQHIHESCEFTQTFTDGLMVRMRKQQAAPTRRGYEASVIRMFKIVIKILSSRGI